MHCSVSSLVWPDLDSIYYVYIVFSKFILFINQLPYFHQLSRRRPLIANIKPKKPNIYRQPKVTESANQVSKSLLNTSHSAAHKTFQVLARHQSETNETNNRYINIMEAQQDINFILAGSHLMVRRMSRSNQEHERLVASGKEDGYIRIAFGWMVDHSLFVLDLIWGVIQPILLILFMLIMRIVLIIVFTALGFYILYLLITD